MQGGDVVVVVVVVVEVLGGGERDAHELLSVRRWRVRVEGVVVVVGARNSGGGVEEYEVAGGV